jgi:hypothetical protein
MAFNNSQVIPGREISREGKAYTHSREISETQVPGYNPYDVATCACVRLEIEMCMCRNRKVRSDSPNVSKERKSRIYCRITTVLDKVYDRFILHGPMTTKF